MSNQAPVRLLSLDGGGAKGWGQLALLGHLVARLKKQLEPNASPDQADLSDIYPCEYFDLIVGTGTGGINALLVGRLGLSIEQCFEAWRGLSRVFQIHRSDGPLFDSNEMEAWAKDLVKEHTGDSETMMRVKDEKKNNNDKTCNVAVSCMRYHNIGPPALLRTYRVRANQDDNCKIWEAIRATTASILLFDPISIGPSYSPQVFVDAELVANNPVTLVYREKEGFYLRVGNKPPPEIGCVVSIGCGSEYPISLKTDDGDDEAKGYWERFKGLFGGNVKEERAKQPYDVMLRIAKDCERQHQQISASYHEDEERVYFRLNVKSGLEAVAATDWTEEERAKITTQSETYLGNPETVEILTSLIDKLGRLSMPPEKAWIAPPPY